MPCYLDRLQVRSLSNFPYKAIAWVALVLASCAPLAQAKLPSLTAIELYDGPSGPAYLQLGGVLINGKVELRDCTSFPAGGIDKSIYGKLQRITLAPGAVIERDSEGVLRYRASEGGTAVCVVPDNVKFDHNASYSASELAELAAPTGTAVGPSGVPAAGPAPIAKGVKLVFIEAPDTELAEFLLAQRAANIAGWQAYLAKYPTSLHNSQAKIALALLYISSGESSLGSYRKSLAAGTPSYDDLKDAKVQADKAHAASPGQEGAAKLSADIRAELMAIVEKGHGKLDAYQDALKSNGPGYAHLLEARKLSEAVTGVDPGYPPGVSLLGDVTQAENTVNGALRSAESAVVAKQMDRAIELITPYRAFAAEEPRVAAVIDAAYNYYLQLGQQLSAAGDWDSAIKQFQKAAATKDTPQVEDLLKEGRRQQVIKQDKAAAVKAQEYSKNYEEQHDNISAFEVLYNLTAAQQALVSDDLERLKPGYIQSAGAAVKNLQKVNIPIRGRGDEIGIEKAYAYLQRLYAITSDESYQDTMNLLGGDLSDYFLDQAKRYLDKPFGSGTELGWAYLNEALRYKPSNQTAHDAIVGAAPAHAMHSKLSISVQFRDQTSLRESTGFIRQLEDAVIAGLEASSLQVKAVRYGEATSGVVPDFQLDGNVLEHRITETSNVESKESQYRTGTHDEPNEDWTKANRTYDAALRQLSTDQSELEGAASKGKKKNIKELTAKVSADQKAVSEAQMLADSLPKTKVTDVIRPYQYKQRTIEIQNVIKLQFRIGDTLSGQMGDPVTVEMEDPKQFVVVEDVKSEDTGGVKQGGPTPNTTELQTALENAARDELNQKVLLKVEDLRQKIYDTARSMEQGENLDGAGEYFLRYLSCAPDDQSEKRRHALQFLAENFNIHPVPGGSQ